MSDDAEPTDDVSPDEEPIPRPPADPLGLARDIARAYRKPGVTPERPRRRRPVDPKPRRGQRDDPGLVGDFLGEVVRDQGWDDRLAAQRVFTDWAAIVGPEVAQHSRVAAFEDAVVHVETSSTAWATQLKFLAPRIVARLNDELGDGSVVRIDVRGPQAPSWKKGPRSIRGARGPRDTYG